MVVKSRVRVRNLLGLNYLQHSSNKHSCNITLDDKARELWERYRIRVEMLPGSNRELRVAVQAGDTGVQLSKHCNKRQKKAK